MGKKSKQKGHLAGEGALKALELPRDIILGMPRISVTGNHEVVIENYRGIIEYENERLKINTEPGVITFSGTGFNICALTDDEIEMEGEIAKIEFSF